MIATKRIVAASVLVVLNGATVDAVTQPPSPKSLASAKKSQQPKGQATANPANSKAARAVKKLFLKFWREIIMVALIPTNFYFWYSKRTALSTAGDVIKAKVKKIAELDAAVEEALKQKNAVSLLSLEEIKDPLKIANFQVNNTNGNPFELTLQASLSPIIQRTVEPKPDTNTNPTAQSLSGEEGNVIGGRPQVK